MVMSEMLFHITLKSGSVGEAKGNVRESNGNAHHRQDYADIRIRVLCQGGMSFLFLGLLFRGLWGLQWHLTRTIR